MLVPALPGLVVGAKISQGIFYKDAECVWHTVNKNIIPPEAILALLLLTNQIAIMTILVTIGWSLNYPSTDYTRNCL